MDKDAFIKANQIAWDEVAPIHARHRLNKLKEDFQQPLHSVLIPVAREQFTKINVQGKSVAQLCCNNGRELLSVKNMGSKRCVGFDISARFIEQAKMLAQDAQIDCEFVQSDVHAIPEQYHNNFDLVYISVGSLCWMPQLPDFFSVVKRLLKPGGKMFIWDMHPILWMFSDKDQADPPEIKHSYFNTEPAMSLSGLDYYSTQPYQAAPTYWFHHKMSDIISSCIKQDLVINKFVEFKQDVSGIFSHFERMKNALPLGYYLIAHKRSGS